MSLYSPATINQNELDILNEPYFGGEWQLWLSHVAAVHIADIDFSSAAVGVLTKDAASALPGASSSPEGANMQAVVVSPLLSSLSPVITLACKDSTAVTPVTVAGVATFAAPTWVGDQAFYFPRGYAVDVIPAVADKRFTDLTSLTSVAGGNKNARVSLYTLPILAAAGVAGDYYMVGCTDAMDFNIRGRSAKGVDCGMETDAFVKAGKSSPGKLTLSSKFKSLADGIARFSGMKGTAMLVGIKDGQVTGDRIVFTQFRPTAEVSLPEGDGEATVKCEGKFVEALMFTAPYSAS